MGVESKANPGSVKEVSIDTSKDNPSPDEIISRAREATGEDLISGSTPAPRKMGRFGLSLKSGEAGGAFGIQVAWNFNRHLQFCSGTGGISDWNTYLFSDRTRTDSYYLMGKMYLDHLYFATGYSLKVSRVELSDPISVSTYSRSEHGIPIHVGYEFGHRNGFFFSTSVGYLALFGGGNRNVVTGSKAFTSNVRTSESGPSLGMAVGYYL